MSEYNVDSKYYCDDTSEFTAISGRTYSKMYAGPAYCFAVGFSGNTEIMVVSKTENYAYYTTSSGQPSYEAGTYTFKNETWYYKRGWGFNAFYANVPRFIDVRDKFDSFPSTFEKVALYCTTIADDDTYILATPKMTSNTTPSGVVSCSSSFASNYAPWYAFDQTIAQDPYTWATINSLPQWISYQFPDPVCIHKVAIENRAETNRRAIETFKFQASNDGTNWTDLETCTSVKFNNYDRSEFFIPNDEEYTYYRLYVTSNFNNLTGSGCGVNEIELYKPKYPIRYKYKNVDMSNPTLMIENSMRVDAVSASENDTTYLGGDYIGCQIAYSGPIDVSEISKITYRLITGACYGGGTYATRERFWYRVGVMRSIPSSFPAGDTSAEMGYIAVNEYKRSNTDYGYQELDISDLTGTIYIVINCHGWTSEISDIKLAYVDNHSQFAGSAEAIRDWFNASFYNKEEIENLFIQNNSGLQAYDLTIYNGEPEQLIQVEGQTSDQVYNLCLAGILEDDTYAYHGLLWFEPDEDIKIYDVESGEELLEYTLDELIDEIELPTIPEPDYDVTSPYYMEETGAFALLYYYSRTYYKLNEGPAYAFCCYDGTDTHAILISLESNNTVYRVNNYQPPANTFTVTLNNKTWYVDGFSYSEPGNYSEGHTDHYINISSGAPYSSHADIALACLQAIYS